MNWVVWVVEGRIMQMREEGEKGEGCEEEEADEWGE